MDGRPYNFSAGPATLPLEVLEEAREELVDYGGTGMSLLEMSHRWDHYERLHHQAAELARSVAGAPADFSVLFLQGGATLQFAMVPMNLLGEEGQAGYVRSGAWSARALEDALRWGRAHPAWDGEPEGYTRMPAAGEVVLRPGSRYLHVTSNETIDGIRMVDWPEVGAPLVADMSSDLLTRSLPWDRFDLVYAGAQKNLGPAGVTVVLVRTSVLETTSRDLPSYLRYDLHHERRSLYNTPPVFAVHLLGKVLAWVERRGGLEAMQRDAERRAELVYRVIEESDGFYRSPVEPASRSVTNVVFRLPSEELEAEFLRTAEEAGLLGLRGHRSVGGIRASMYNAMPVEGAERLAGLMEDFAAGR